jgi:uncharacterized membrane protein
MKDAEIIDAIIATNLNSGLKSVGGYIERALSEIATELGGEELRKQALTASLIEGGFPSPESLKLLESIEPGSADRVMTRAEEIQREGIAAAQQPKSRIRRLGRKLLKSSKEGNS